MLGSRMIPSTICRFGRLYSPCRMVSSQLSPHRRPKRSQPFLKGEHGLGYESAWLCVKPEHLSAPVFHRGLTERAKPVWINGAAPLGSRPKSGPARSRAGIVLGDRLLERILEVYPKAVGQE